MRRDPQSVLTVFKKIDDIIMQKTFECCDNSKRIFRPPVKIQTLIGSKNNIMIMILNDGIDRVVRRFGEAT